MDNGSSMAETGYGERGHFHPFCVLACARGRRDLEQDFTQQWEWVMCHRALLEDVLHNGR